ncbi:hypothetical protein HON36_02060 [Candidatus Parcubacteria bacterium]|jgi:hypothetical protein|nr:hypothetical protein [Candidatus Parcubacteria bacterium]MBT7228309.1 hypothetical protein [Candidatus Parcubacteria bacterium]
MNITESCKFLRESFQRILHEKGTLDKALLTQDISVARDAKSGLEIYIEHSELAIFDPEKILDELIRGTLPDESYTAYFRQEGYIEALREKIKPDKKNRRLIITGVQVDFSKRPIGNLPDSLMITGDLFLEYSGIGELPNRLMVQGDLNISRTKIKNLPDDLIVKGILYIDSGALRLQAEVLKEKGQIGNYEIV